MTHSSSNTPESLTSNELRLLEAPHEQINQNPSLRPIRDEKHLDLPKEPQRRKSYSSKYSLVRPQKITFPHVHKAIEETTSYTSQRPLSKAPNDNIPPPKAPKPLGFSAPTHPSWAALRVSLIHVPQKHANWIGMFFVLVGLFIFIIWFDWFVLFYDSCLCSFFRRLLFGFIPRKNNLGSGQWRSLRLFSRFAGTKGPFLDV